MNYFELFAIPVSLKVNTKELAPRFFELSKKYHPDFFIKDSVEAQAEALEKSSLLNKAWKTFQSEDATLKYVLQLKNRIEEEEKYELPPDFLMEVLEINESLMDADEPEVAENIRSSVNRLYEEIYNPVRQLVENYKDETVSDTELGQLKEYYYKKKYLDRISSQLAGKS
ncbi:MAG TPA: Fe-S protein assembly co-chaperone HscB [Chitinophagaceae bacterium]|nr:Fe-S protein assembly co-chaperone HscB [Chitinophagaceae bacterium]MCB9056912.1 Fe-S protein assembly co-chaperone HscB [Chitinophagales bacterium]HPG12250.1 Fe-S protein assembly co-chaperone HscB [Chitinophagaceae bacterium]